MAGSIRTSITRRADFSASHLCSHPERSEEENRALYGPATRAHGHNYRVEVTVSGEVDPVLGMVLDLKELKASWSARWWSPSTTASSTMRCRPSTA